MVCSGVLTSDFFLSKKLLFPGSIVIFWKFLMQSVSFVGSSEINTMLISVVLFC